MASFTEVKRSNAELLRNQIHRTEVQEPHFAQYHDRCNLIFGQTPCIELALEAEEALFHEAGVYIAKDSAVFVTSNQIIPDPNGEKTIYISRLSRDRQSGKWSRSDIPPGQCVLANGGVNYPSAASILFCAQGDKTAPGGLVLMKDSPPYTTSLLLQSYHGRWFNSVNDVVVHSDASIWFTDPIYGHEQGIRPTPQLPNQVYRHDPSTGQTRVVADGFGRPNGICFSPDELTCYITDTEWIHGDGTLDDTRASHVYAFDVVERHGAPFLCNRRVFAMADTGIPDGIKCDVEGNVYSGCGDGVSIWGPDGVLLGKIIVPGGVANFCFGEKGELFLLNETRFWVARIGQHVQGALLKSMKLQ